MAKYSPTAAPPVIAGQIRDCVIRDYFTPNVTAEVVIGCLLTPKLPHIINAQCGLDTVYVAKEMSVPTQSHKDNRGCKIDYVLADNDTVYLTELKTTPSSGSNSQLVHYEDACSQWTFGESLGKRLLKILANEFSLGRITAKVCNDGGFASFFEAITRRKPGKDGNAELAMRCVKTIECAWRSASRSKKYLLTLGEILDYLKGGERSLWDKPMMIIYLAPAKLGTKLESPHVCCLPTLEKAVSDLGASEDEYSLFLASILEGIFEREKDGPFGSTECAMPLFGDRS